MPPELLEALAGEVALLIKGALGPVLERLAVAEAQLVPLIELRDRVLVVETKAAAPAPLSPLVTATASDLAPVLERVAAAEARLATLGDLRDRVVMIETKAAAPLDLGDLRERVAVLETRPLVSGPQGDPGAPGLPGQNGTAGLSFEGVYQDGKSYEKGHLVTWAGSSWHCNEPTTSKPGDGSKAWTLMVKRGRDGKDGNDAPGGVPVVSVGGKR